MSSLALFNSSGSMPFLALTAFFLLIGPVLFMGITTIWSNIKQKVSDELYARAIEIDDLDTPEIEKNLTISSPQKLIRVFLTLNPHSLRKSVKFMPKSMVNLLQKPKKKARDNDFNRKAQKILNDNYES